MSFSLSGGVEVYGFIAPTEITDQYPVIDPLYGIDGFRNVDTLSDLNNIPNLRRRAGMVVGVGGGSQYYKLNLGPWNGTITDWSLFQTGGGGSFTGGTVSGDTTFLSGLTANTLNVNGNLTVTGNTSLQGLTATTISATTYQNLPVSGLTPGNNISISGSNGNFTISFTGSTGLIYFLEGQSTTGPNTGTPINSLSAITSANNVDIAIIPKGDGALMLDIPDNTTTGGNKRGARAIDLQLTRSVNSQVASGNDTVTIGQNNTATNNFSVAIGRANNAGSNYAICLGNGNTITNTASIGMALGSSNTVSNDGFVIGYFGHNHGVIGRIVQTSGRHSKTGDAQKSTFVLRAATTANTITTATTNGLVGGNNNQVILSNQSAYRFKGTIVGKQQGSINSAAWDIDGFIVRGANAATTTLNVGNVTLVQNTPTWVAPTLTADTTNGGLRIQVTGVIATNIYWTVVVETTETIYS